MTTPSGRPTNPIPGMEIPPDMEPVYANMVRLSHTPAEMMFDFALMLPGSLAAKVLARLLMSPIGAKLFHRALGENLARYEAAYGEIKIPSSGALADQLFRPAPPPEPPEPT